jgi:hypothetical protein
VGTVGSPLRAADRGRYMVTLTASPGAFEDHLGSQLIVAGDPMDFDELLGRSRQRNRDSRGVVAALFAAPRNESSQPARSYWDLL